MSTKKIALTALLCSTMFATPAFAQDEQVAQDDSAVDESIIIVTATRRAADVQDIPIAVTAISPVQLERQGVVSVQQLGQVSASFSSSQAQLASGSVVLRIRGVGTTSNNIGFESAVGIFVDGAYQSRPGVALSEFVDVERVEVLRGPQGTLFGRNTSAGALTVTNNRPNLNEFGGFANASYGNFNLISVQGAVNAPLIQDTLALRVTGAYRKRDGFIDIVNGTGKIGESNGIDQYLIRGQLGFETPGGISGRIIGDYSRSTADCCAAIEVSRSALETTGLLGALGLGARGGIFQPNTGLQAVNDRIASANAVPTTDVDQWGVTGEITVPVGENNDLIYIGSYRKYNAEENYDSDFTALDVFNVGPIFTDIKTMTHELRLQGDLFDGALEFLVGGYYSTEDITQQVTYKLGTQYDRFAGALFAGGTGGASLNPASPLFVGPTPISFLSGGINPAGTSSTNNFTQNSKSWSIFTNNTLEIIKGLKATIGLRYSDESKDGGFQQLANNNPACRGLLANAAGIPGPLLGTSLVLGCFPFTAPADLPQAAVFPLPRTYQSPFNDSELIYTGKLAYEFAVPVTIYGSFTHGYKSGGLNLDVTAAIGGANPAFRSEKVNAYEIGFKARALNNALTANIALFKEDFTDFQVLEFTGTRFQTFNVPKAQTSGVEIETSLRPDDHFTFDMALTYIDAKYPQDCAGTSTDVNILSLCGQDLTNAGKYTAIGGATYRNTIGDSLSFFLNGQIRLESDQRTSTQAIVVPATIAGIASAPPLPFDQQDGNVRINLRAGIGGPNDRWGIEGWVQNLTNEITRGVTFNTTLRSGSRSAFIQQPRTFGVTLRGKF